MIPRPRTLRWRIQTWHGLLLVAVLAGLGATAYRLERTNAFRHLDTELEKRLGALHSAVGGRPGGPRRPPPDAGPPPESHPPPGRGEPRGPDPGRPPRPGSFQLPDVLAALFDPGEEPAYFYHLWTRHGEVFGAAAHAPVGLPMPPRADAGPGTETRDGRRLAWKSTPPGEVLLVGATTAPTERELTRFAWWLAGGGLAVLALGLVGGGWLTARALSPVQEIGAVASRVAEGRMGARISVAEPGSELGNLAAALNQTFARLEAAFSEQARFTADAAHELLTPTSVLLAQTQLALHRPRSAEEYRETIVTVRRAAQRIHNLCESLLTLTCFDSHTEPLQLRACDLAEVAREQMEALQPLADERGIALAQEGAPCPCQADPDRLAQVFTNLLVNAIKYSRPGDRVTLTTERIGNAARIRIADTGPGIAPEHLPHLFERFYRADASRNRATGGAGLGLAICKTLVEAHGGTISVQSEPASGTILTVTLPSEAPGAPSGTFA